MHLVDPRLLRSDGSINGLPCRDSHSCSWATSPVLGRNPPTDTLTNITGNWAVFWGDRFVNMGMVADGFRWPYVDNPIGVNSLGTLTRFAPRLVSAY